MNNCKGYYFPQPSASSSTAENKNNEPKYLRKKFISNVLLIIKFFVFWIKGVRVLGC